MGQEAEIILLPHVVDDLVELVNILYQQEWFGFFENSLDYVDSIIDFAFSISELKCKLTKKNKYGKYYCTYKSKPTAWYVVFDIEDNVYLIKLITNSKGYHYPTYIRGY